MRLSFPNGEHADVVVEQGELRVGAAADNRVVIEGAGLADHHASFVVDPQRGILLRLLSGSSVAHVNARPVRRLALLRLGDVVSLGSLQVLVKPDSDGEIRSDVPAEAGADAGSGSRGGSRVVLRAVAGRLFGRSFPLDAPLTIGRGSAADIRLDDPALAERHARVEQHGTQVVLRDLGSSDGSVVNGVPVRDALLHPGDQIALEHDRFVLEAPGLPARGRAAPPAPRSGGGITQTMQAVNVPSGPAPAPAAGSGGNVWWLIGAAVLIMVALAALLLAGPLQG